MADVRDGTEEQRSLALFNGQHAVGIDITKSKGASTTAVADAVKAAIEKIQPTLPPGVKLRWCATPASGCATRCATSRRR